MTAIIPAIIPESFEELQEKMSLVADLVDIVQIDVMDGTYTKEKTWPYLGDKRQFEKIASEEEGMPAWRKVDFEVDMMVSEPEKKVENWVMSGASRVIIHIESTSDEKIKEIIDDYRGAFVEVGLALKPSTSSGKLEEFIEDIDFVQCMGSDTIGRSGVDLDERVYDKIREIRNIHPEMPIAIDIGVDFETAPNLVEAGASRLVSGSTIFGSGDPSDAISDLRDMVYEE